MDPQTLIFDISSDEEIGLDNSSSADNFDWVSKLLEDDDVVGGVFPVINNLQNPACDAINQNSAGSDESNVSNNINTNDDDDDDDVVVVGEVIVKPRRVNRSIQTPAAGCDDDDCVVLESDPEKPPTAATVAANDDGLKMGEDDDGDEDDLVVVGEKGQVACRDFAHSRHMCANLPFSSTPHESRCEQCHCYVCDSLAPCVYWGTGASSTDHCNATDKVEFWQLERKRFRQLQNPSLATTNPVSPLPQPPQSVRSAAQPSVLSRMATSCAVTSPYSVQRMMSRSNQSERQLYQSRLVSRQLSRAYKGNGHSNRVVHQAARMVPSHAVYKRSGCSRRPVVVNRSPYNSPGNISVAYVQPQDQQLAGKPAVKPRDPRLVINLRSCQSNTSSISLRTLPVPLRGHGLSSSQTPESRFRGFGQSAAETSDQPHMYSVYQTQRIASPIIPDNTSSALNSFSQNSQQHSSVTEYTPGQNVACPVPDVLTSVSQSVNQPLALPQTYYSPLEPCGAPNAVNVSQSYEHPVTENPAVEQSVPLHEHVPSTELDSSDFDFDSWLDDFEPQGLFSDMNSQASGTAPLNPGMLYFDFETSWKGVTNGT